MRITARVVYPVDVEIEVSKKIFDELVNGEYETINKIREKLFEEADNSFHKSIKPKIIKASLLNLEM